MSDIRWYDPNVDQPHTLAVCDSEGECDLIEPSEATPLTGCYSGTHAIGEVHHVLLVDAPRTSPMVFVPEPAESAMIVLGMLLLVGLYMVRSRRG